MKKIILCLACLLFFPWHIQAENIVDINHIYTYEKMEADLNTLQKKYKKMDIKKIGESHHGREIWAAKLGNGEQDILLVGAHHGREWLTASLLMKMLETYNAAYAKNQSIDGFSTGILNEVSIWFVPMLNPDGVTIQQGDMTGLSWPEKAALWRMNNLRFDYRRWKANGIGIDLNRQYPAGWKNSKAKAKRAHYQFYKGRHPLQAKEALALAKFTREIKPEIAAAYHTSGREIFWYYHNKPENVTRDYLIAKKMASLTGYELSLPEKHAVGSGFTDWFITEFNRPALTIELSYLVGETSPPLSVFAEEWERNKAAGLMLANEAKSTGKKNKNDDLFTY
ncbi:carboxypeptidase [Peribacillus cavernae]|uniref:Carboxypeptidase n=1 Tax=Peribacillus cavernae TaxID=1674310 RepID=A0A433HE76_9BACI|nr:M14 family zinc carboxypeptidase [Peribacillus cavernae]MDQ0219907.1 g-D-glutamyl-meso-diaminopimelate peptidase [Peribacillus cavernae]RUQ26610.1 carboxypeptidase [Peribacillus cavernae]